MNHLVTVSALGFFLTIFIVTADPSPVDCQWKWTEWTACDPGSCQQPRNRQDRYRTLTKAAQFGGKPCPFSVGARVENYTRNDNAGTSRVEYRSCVPGDACYSKKTCKSGEFTCRTERCIENKHRCNGDYDCQDQSDEEHCTSVTLSCVFSKSPDIIRNNNSADTGFNIMSKSPASPVVSSAFFGSCITTPYHNKEFRLPHNFDTYNYINTAQGWTTRKFETFHDLARYIITYTGLHYLPGELYSLFKTNYDKYNYYFAKFLFTFDNIGLRTSSQLELATEFINSLNGDIPRQKSYEKYFSMYDLFGTDYTTVGLRGGYMYIIKAADKCNRQPEFAQYDNILTFPGWIEDATFKTVLLQMNGGREQERSMLQSSTSKANIESWILTISDHPAPIFMNEYNTQHQTDRIYSLLESQYLTLPYKSTIKNVMRETLSDYQQPFQKSLCSACPNTDYLVMAADPPGETGHYGCMCVPVRQSDVNCGAWASDDASPSASSPSASPSPPSVLTVGLMIAAGVLLVIFVVACVLLHKSVMDSNGCSRLKSLCCKEGKLINYADDNTITVGHTSPETTIETTDI